MRVEIEAVPVVDGQIDAYNRGDADGFAAFYADAALVVDAGDGRVVAAGRARIRDVWAALFESRRPHCDVLRRIVMPPFVFDRERIVFPSGPDAEGVAAYEIDGAEIVRAWLFKARAGGGGAP